MEAQIANDMTPRTEDAHDKVENMIDISVVTKILIDSIIKLSGRQPIVMKLQRRLYLAQISLAYFMRQTFDFENVNYVSLLHDLHGSGRNVEERLEHLKKSDVFQRIRTKAPDLFDKLEAVEGDICERGMGVNVLVPQERLSNVSVIIHGAASVRFDDPLKKAAIINICGTREILNFAETLTKLQVFLHISTTFCYPEYKFLQEELYPPTADWRKILGIIESLDEEVVCAMEKKIIGHQPNTYTFTKNLSEHLVYEYRQKVPIVIYRPSIVTPAVMEPFAGWNDNVNGPVGIMMATGSGLIRTLFTDHKVVLDFNPIDVTVKAIIIAIRRQGIRTREEIFANPPPIYNGSSRDVNPVSYYELAMLGNSCIPMVPFDYMVWPISFIATTWFLLFYLRVIFLQLAPSEYRIFSIRVFPINPEPPVTNTSRPAKNSGIGSNFPILPNTKRKRFSMYSRLCRISD
uniref:Fatty acyl-CoA reductase n=1 Tax=Phlebotomus papatasi TaxID=29031 RepID=A0A1B0DE71_PHLPP